MRVPSDPLNPGTQIWLYYTHMADQFGNSFISEEFPAGTSEKPIEAGVFLGYQGDYSGDPNNPVGVHLHFSSVEDDGTGQFKNELEIENTLDPSPYLGLPLNGYENSDRVPVCEQLRLSGSAIDQFRGDDMAFGSLVYYRQIAELPPPIGRGLYLGGSLEVGWLSEAEVREPGTGRNMLLSSEATRYGGSLFFGSDTWIGPAYLGFGLSGDGESSIYVLIGRP